MIPVSPARRVSLREKPLALLALATALLGCGALVSKLVSAPRPQEPAGLEVAIASPRGEVRELFSIDVVFSEPMVALGARRGAKTDPPLSITPSIPGSFSWIGTRALSFIPRPPIPPGTRLACRVPRGTRSLEGRTLAADYAWEIVVDRPRVVRSFPRSLGMIAPDAPLVVLFSQEPAPGAERRIRLSDGEGSIDLERLAADSATIAEAARGLTIPVERVRESLLVLRPRRALVSGRTYRLEIPREMEFRGTDVTLDAPYGVEFTTFDAPRIVSLHASVGSIDLTLGGPVDPDTLRRYLTAEPPIRDLEVLPVSGTEIRLAGSLRAGGSHTIRLAAGLPSLLGARLASPEVQRVVIPHHGASLDLVPSGGYLPRTEDVRIRLLGTNVDTVDVSGAWVPADSMPSRLARASEGRNAGWLPRLARWHEPRVHPESLLAVDIGLGQFGKRPAGARAVQIRARALSLYVQGEERTRFRREGLIQVTDLGLSCFAGNDRGLAWVTRLSTGRPVSGAEVRLHVPGTARPLWTGRTDAEGIAWLPGLDELRIARRSPVVAEARTGEDGVWLLVLRGGMRPSRDTREDRAYVMTDRPLYRPGETVKWVVFARQTGSAGVLPTTLQSLGYVVRSGHPQKILDRGSIALAPPGNGAAGFRLPSDVAPGSYEILLFPSAKTGEEAMAWHTFSVEEYRLPRFEARARATPARAISGETVHVDGRFRYLGGGPLASAPVRWTLERRPDWTAPEGYWDFSFQDERLLPPPEMTHGGWATRVASGEGVLDRDGAIRLPFSPSLEGLGQDQVYVLEIGARDLADRSAYDVASFRAQRAELRVGARARVLVEAKELDLTAAAFDTSGSPVSGVALRWQIERRDWKTVRIRRIGGSFGYENVPSDTVLARGESVSSVPPSGFTWSPPKPGLYSFLVETTDTKGRSTRARADAYAPGEKEAASWYRDDRAWLELKPDRASYAPGDTAHVLVPAPAIPTEGLVLVLDNGIRSARRLSRVQGSPSVAVPLADARPSAIWLQTVLVGPASVPEDGGRMRRLPYFGWGQTDLTIRSDDWRIAVEVAPERAVYRPGEEVTVVLRLRDAKGRPLDGTATLAVVDDAIFELYGEDAIDPLSALHAFRGPGTIYQDVRNELHPPSLGEKGRLTPGGDGGLDAGTAPRKRFLPTVHWEPLAPVGPGGETRLRFTLADDLTRYRMRVVATSGADRFGYGEAKIDVRKPLMLEWGLPRFAREGDRVTVAAVVRLEGEKSATVRVRAEATGGRLQGRIERKITVKPPKAGRAEFTLIDLDTAGVVLRLRAESEAGGDAAEIAIPIDRPLVWDRSFTAGKADPDARVRVAAERGILPDQGGLTATVSPSMLSGLTPAFEYVIDYPYACLEQLSSSLLGLVAEKAALTHLGLASREDEAARGKRASEILAQIGRCVEPWEIRAWPSGQSGPASDYVVGYALHAALRAREAKLPIEAAMIDRLAEEAANRLQRMREGSEGVSFPGIAPGAVAARRLPVEAPWLLFVLSEAERGRSSGSARVDAALVQALFERRAQSPIESRMLLGLTLAALRERGDAESIRRSWPAASRTLLEEIRARDTRRTGRHVWIETAVPEWGDGIGRDVRATAFFLQFLAIADPSDPDLQGVVAWLLDERRPATGWWSNNHSTALALDAVCSVVPALEGPPSEVSGRIGIGARSGEFRFTIGGASAWERFTPMRLLPQAPEAPAETEIRIETDGRRAVYYAATLDQARPALEEPPREEGMIIERGYVDAEGKPLEEEIPVGAPLFVHLAVVVSRDAKTLVVEDPLPAGIEPLQLRFQNAPRVSMSEAPSEEDAEEKSRLWIVHRELRDRAVRLFAENVQAGIYHIYYPVLASTAGEYRVPGARAEDLYSPEIYGTSEPLRVRIEGGR